MEKGKCPPSSQMKRQVHRFDGIGFIVETKKIFSLCRFVSPLLEMPCSSELLPQRISRWTSNESSLNAMLFQTSDPFSRWIDHLRQSCPLEVELDRSGWNRREKDRSHQDYHRDQRPSSFSVHVPRWTFTEFDFIGRCIQLPIIEPLDSWRDRSMLCTPRCERCSSRRDAAWRDEHCHSTRWFDSTLTLTRRIEQLNVHSSVNDQLVHFIVILMSSTLTSPSTLKIALNLSENEAQWKSLCWCDIVGWSRLHRRKDRRFSPLSKVSLPSNPPWPMKIPLNTFILLLKIILKRKNAELILSFSGHVSGFLNLANKTFANWTLANGENPWTHWRKYRRLSPIGEDAQSVPAKVQGTFANWRKSSTFSSNNEAFKSCHRYCPLRKTTNGFAVKGHWVSWLCLPLVRECSNITKPSDEKMQE